MTLDRLLTNRPKRPAATFACGSTLLLLLSLASPSAMAESSQTAVPQDDIDQLLDLSLQDLLNIEVTSAARREQTLTSVPSAIYVITSDDIERMGATSIPDALRMVPGLHVADIDGNKWIVSSRGFSSRFANKLLVQIDGRSVYTPSYSGVYWDMQDTPMSDVERIEVIRGPGATLWGANAVNGIINVITKSAAATQGGLVETSVGDKFSNITSVRYGGELNETTTGRAYVKSRNQDSNHLKDTDTDANDSWNSVSAGFRLDGESTGSAEWTLQGDIFSANENQIISTLWQPSPTNIETDVKDSFESKSWNLLGRWKQPHSNGDVSTLQLYWDHAQRDEIYVGQEHDTLDIDYQQQLASQGAHNIIWGLGYRYIQSDYRNSFAVSLNPESQDFELFSGFVQDEISLIPNQLNLTLGTKLEHNDNTDWELQPSAKLMWMAIPGHSFWGSIARAVRTPSAIENSGSVVVTTSPSTIAANGNPDLNAEALTAYELGYRYHGNSVFSLDATVFYNDYDELTSFLTSPLMENSLYGDTYGVELSGIWQTLSWWQLKASYSYLQVNVASKKPGDTSNFSRHEDTSPEHMFSIESEMDITQKVTFDTWLYYIDATSPDLTAVTNKDVDAYFSVNARVAWKPYPDLTLALRANDIFNDQQQESVGGFFSAPTDIERSVVAELHWAF